MDFWLNKVPELWRDLYFSVFQLDLLHGCKFPPSRRHQSPLAIPSRCLLYLTSSPSRFHCCCGTNLRTCAILLVFLIFTHRRTSTYRFYFFAKTLIIPRLVLSEQLHEVVLMVATVSSHPASSSSSSSSWLPQALQLPSAESKETYDIKRRNAE